MIKIPNLQELLEAGVHFGHQVRRGHPRMKPYIYGVREGVHIIDLIQSEKNLQEACRFVHQLGKMGKTLLFVGCKKQAKPIVQELASGLESPYLVERWMGGFLTNFEEIKKRIKLLKDLQDKKTKGELSKYTKKEQLLLDRKMNKLFKDFSGVMELQSLPDAVFVVDAVSDNIAVREANRLGIKVVAIADSNCDVSEIDFPIPGNDDAIKSIKILADAVAGAFGEGKKEAGKVKAAKELKESKQKEEIDEQLTEEVAETEEVLEKKAVKDAERVVE